MEDPKPLSVAEFLAWEARQSTNHELIDGVIVAMSNPTKAHGRLVRRLNRAIDAAVGDDCDVYAGDMTVSIEGVERDSAPRPDIVVTCDEFDRHPGDGAERTISRPKLIVEVLSPRTAATDLGTKLRNYFSIPNLVEYLLVDSRIRDVRLYRRVAGEVLVTWPDPIILTSIDCEISVEGLYAGIALPAGD
jgi:Uma2 family endonuclease